MTVSDYRKVFKQLNVKPNKKKKYIKHNAKIKRSCGITTRRCRVCGTHKGHIDSYGLDLCRRCFRDFALDLGFKKYN